ncbi:MAG: YggS family pyridoxal phosphate-dependent enzyme [Lachnospiraceae bacterium]|nr:YggS family pyridoxal phosphate-dependent enzyme [Lachnospiraceae bacterium]
MSIAENLQQIRGRAEAACLRAGRDPREVTLIAVSKTNPASAVCEAAAAGQTDFGENKAQEMCAKQEECPKGLRWHFIGNLQRNKVKYVVGRSVLIHSVNSPQLAREIERVSAARGLISDVLLEINIADEASKHGTGETSAEELLRAAAALPHLRVRGLMAVPPPADTPEENRPYFRKMRQLQEKLKALGLPGVQLSELSMGMTGDFETAIEE